MPICNPHPPKSYLGTIAALYTMIYTNNSTKFLNISYLKPPISRYFLLPIHTKNRSIYLIYKAFISPHNCHAELLTLHIPPTPSHFWLWPGVFEPQKHPPSKGPKKQNGIYYFYGDDYTFFRFTYGVQLPT